LLWNSSTRKPFQPLVHLRFDSKPPLKAICSPIIVVQGYFSNEIYKAGSTDCVKTTVQRLLQQHTPDSIYNGKHVPILEHTDTGMGPRRLYIFRLRCQPTFAVRAATSKADPRKKQQPPQLQSTISIWLKSMIVCGDLHLGIQIASFSALNQSAGLWMSGSHTVVLHWMCHSLPKVAQSSKQSSQS
jgi:hypothetical protein